MRDRKLTGPWAGFSFQSGCLITPEGRSLKPEDLTWLSLTACIAQEWRAMMTDERSGHPCDRPGQVVYLRDELRRRRAAKAGQQDPVTGDGADTG